MSESISAAAEKNLSALKAASYPGRGIIIGKTENGSRLVQIYWIMGRSENSRNRIFIQEGRDAKTAAFDESKLTDPSLIIYYPLRERDGFHIITNGDQTDTIADGLQEGKSFSESLETRGFEPDGPNFTPRISGLIDLNDVRTCYSLSILKTQFNDEKYPVHFTYQYNSGINGYGHGLTTYVDDGNPLPSFSGEPHLYPLKDTIDSNLDFYWSVLDNDNLVSMLVKYIDPVTGRSEIKIRNKHQN